MQVRAQETPARTAKTSRQPMRILVIEDDREAAGWLVKGLAESGHVADHAADGEEGLGLALEGSIRSMISTSCRAARFNSSRRRSSGMVTVVGN